MPKIIKILTTFDIFEPDLRVLKRKTFKYKFLDKLIKFSGSTFSVLRNGAETEVNGAGARTYFLR